MTDPTKQAQAATATAKTAREVIREVMAAAYAYLSAHIGSDRLRATPEGRRFDDGLIALRALLDAPEGGVGRLHRALDVWTEQYGARKGDVTAISRDAHLEIGNAWAALRASPESVGGATPSSRAAEAINTAGRIVREAEAERDNAQRTASSLSVELAVAAKERDALKADLAAARGEVIRLQSALTAADDIARGLTSTPAPLSDRAKWVAQYIKEHVSLDEDNARVLAKEGAEILRIAEQAVKDARG